MSSRRALQPALGPLLVALALPLALDACAADHTALEPIDAQPACEPGDEHSCRCEDGHAGTALCDASGQEQPCSCQPARTLPCSAPGAAFQCLCADGAVGAQLCLATGRYSACACDNGTSPATTAPDASVVDASRPAVSTECPAPFSCVSQMGYQVCADDTGLPPLCAAQPNCASAGLPHATCLDPGVGGVMLCVQACTP